MTAAPVLQLVPLDARRPEPEQLFLRPFFVVRELATPPPAVTVYGSRRPRCASLPGRAAPAPQPYGPIQLHPLPLETWRPPPRRRPSPVRPPGLHAYVPRRQRPGARPKSMGLAPLSELERAQLERDEAWLRANNILQYRPVELGDCLDAPGPCPWVSCTAHLYLDVDELTGALKVNFPDKEPWELTETCAHRVVTKRGALSLEEVGKLTNVTEEWVRQIEGAAMRKLKRWAAGARRPGASG